MARRKFDTRTEWQTLASICNSRYPERRFKYYGAVTPELFGHAECQEVLQRIAACLQHNGAIPSFDVLADDPKLSQRTRMMMSQHIPMYRSEADFELAVKTLVSYKETRELYRTFEGLRAILTDDESPEDHARAESLLEETLFKLRTQNNDEHIIDGRADSPEMLKLAQEALTYANVGRRFKTGWGEFDDLTGGLEPGNVLLLSANTGGGKSIAALSLFTNMYRCFGYNITYISLEMTERELMERMLSNVTGTEYKKIRDGKLNRNERLAVYTAYKEQFHESSSGRYSFYAPKGDYDIEQLFDQVRGRPTDVLFLDYLSLVKPGSYGGRNSTEEFQLRQMTRIAKRTAERMSCAIVLLVQLNDEGQIMYSKGIGHHVHYWLKWFCQEEDVDRGFVTVEMGKSRNSRRKDLYCTTDFAHMRMDNVENPPGLADYKASQEKSERSGYQKKPGDPGKTQQHTNKTSSAQLPRYEEAL